MAHIDAGKTTTTERMLYYTGVTRKLGDVDDGSTVMDYMQLERERGITINAAAITFNWKQHRINLIDTPGHVDFTFEVERSLKVLDGAVALFDGSAGVEAQTVAVWKQADKYEVPRVAFVNKMDKPAASLSYTVDSMHKKLHTTPLVVQLPLGQGKDFCGMVDLVAMDILAWAPGSDGLEYSRTPLVPLSAGGGGDLRCLRCLSDPLMEPPLQLSKRLWEEILQARCLLAEQVLTLDDQLLDDQLLADSFDPVTLPPTKLKDGLRRITLGCRGVPVLCGSSLKNKGIQPLLDGILQYLPAPNERDHGIPNALKELCAYAFKVVHDPQRGALVYLRLYGGSIRTHRGLYNFSRGKEEKITKLYVIQADELVEVMTMSEGNIVAAVGLKNTITGDVLVQSAAAAKAVKKELEGKGGVAPAVLQGLKVPEPAFFCTIEPETSAQQTELDHALQCLSREDPSLRVSVDPDTRQVVLSGMGELHLEIIHDRIQRDYHVQANLGELCVAYREAPTTPVALSGSLDRNIGNKRQFVSLSLAITPLDSGQMPQIHMSPSVSIPSWTTTSDVLEAFRGGAEIACGQGPLLGFPIRNVQIELVDVVLGVGTSMAVISACVSETVSKALRKTEVQLLEPFSQLVVTVPEELLGTVLSDLTSARRGVVNEVTSHDQIVTVTAHVPVASLMGYSTALRSITSGSGSFVSLFSRYEPVSRLLEKTITEQLRGYV